MEKLIVLGTGNAMVTKCFNTCFAIYDGDEYFLVDAGGGNGILSALERCDIAYQKLHHMFITHGHTDHILGTAWIIRKIGTLMNQERYDGKFYIYCQKELVTIIQTIAEMTVMKKFTKYIGDRIIFEEIQNGDQKNILSMQVTFFDIHSKKAKQHGFTVYFKNGVKLTCLGDEPFHESCLPYVQNSDWLLCEAFCLYRDRDVFHPYEKHHSTVKEACEIAAKMNIQNLVLWHTEDKNLADRKNLYTEEGKKYFPGNLNVPNDLETLFITCDSRI